MSLFFFVVVLYYSVEAALLPLANIERPHLLLPVTPSIVSPTTTVATDAAVQKMSQWRLNTYPLAANSNSKLPLLFDKPIVVGQKPILGHAKEQQTSALTNFSPILDAVSQTVEKELSDINHSLSKAASHSTERELEEAASYSKAFAEFVRDALGLRRVIDVMQSTAATEGEIAASAAPLMNNNTNEINRSSLHFELPEEGNSTGMPFSKVLESSWNTMVIKFA